jgi:hypothetical protein
MKYPLLPLPFVCLLSVASGSVAAWAQVDATPPIPGVVGKLNAVTSNSIEIQTKSGVVLVEIKQPLRIYREVPSDLSHVTSSTYVGVTSVKQANGMELAQHIMIFPTELRGAAEGSFMMDAAPDATTHSRMTNGSVARPPASNSRMTNGTVRKGGGTTLLVHYQDGAQTISVPPNVPVSEAAPVKMTLTQGDTIYVATTKQPNGPLTTDKILFVAGAEPPSTTKQR